MKNSKAFVAILVLVIVIAVAFLVYRIATGRSKPDLTTDEAGRDVEVPPEMVPQEQGGTAPEEPDISTD